MKFHKKKIWGGGGSEGGGQVGGLGWWGVKVDVNEELKFLWKFKKKIGGGGGVGGVGSGGGGGGLGGQGGCERRIEVFGKIHKKNSGGGQEMVRWGGGGRVDGGGQEGVRWGGRVDGGVRVDVNAMLGVGGDVGDG